MEEKAAATYELILKCSVKNARIPGIIIISSKINHPWIFQHISQSWHLLQDTTIEPSLLPTFPIAIVPVAFSQLFISKNEKIKIFTSDSKACSE